jgi:hypothetical protein
MLESMKDAIEVQAAWLELLARRTRSFQAAFLKQTAALM